MGAFSKNIAYFCCCYCCKLGSTVSSPIHHTSSSQNIPKLALPETRRLTTTDTPRVTPPNAPRVTPPDTPRQTTPDTPSSLITSITLETEPKQFELTIEDIYPKEPHEIITTVIYPFDESLLVRPKEREFRIFSPSVNQPIISAIDRKKRNSSNSQNIDQCTSDKTLDVPPQGEQGSDDSDGIFSARFAIEI